MTDPMVTTLGIEIEDGTGDLAGIPGAAQISMHPMDTTLIGEIGITLIMVA